jgi:cell wall-associated NlpC family hydrolase
MPLTPAKRLAAVGTLLAVCVLATFTVFVPAAGAQTADDKRSEARQIAAKLDELREKQMELGATYERASYELHLAEQKVAEAQELADEVNAELEQRQKDLRDYAVSAYQGGNDAPTAAALFSGGANSGVVKRFYLETTSGNRNDLIDALHAAQLAADEEAQRLEDAQAEAAEHLEGIEQARAEAAEATAEQQAINDRVQGELASLVAEEAAARAAANPVAASLGSSSPSTAAAPSSTSPAPRANAPAPAPSPAPGPAPSPSPAPPPSGSGASGAISAALSKVGSPYVWGAAGPNSFDCSGLVLWAYAQVGIRLPHYSGAQYASTTRISASQLQPGDLVFWGPGGSEHVAIYMGGNQLVHAYSSNRAVGVTALNGWWKAPSGYGRIN